MTTFMLIDGPTVLLDHGGLRLLVDPTFDPPRTYEGGATVLRKLNEPAVAADQLPPIDAVLVSHDQHPDNLDVAGHELVARSPLALTTKAGAERLGGRARGIEPWSSVTLQRPDAPALTVTAVPAQHGPDGSEPLVGQVIGFHLAAPDLPTVYISGDNASLNVVEHVVDRLGTVDIAILNAGAVRVPGIDGELTLTSANAVEAARLLGARWVAPVHYDGWGHFTEGRDELVAAFTAAGATDGLVLPEPGVTVELA
ncbi:MAG TPA: MBL fold metallo-hydrolase [Conexibacter sp.]|jgi:L-ascorbate metabolism protein UlaG (beta-lactamase superfamily)